MDPIERSLREIDSVYYGGNVIYHRLCFFWPYTNRKIQYLGRIIYSINFTYGLYVTALATKRRVFVTPIDWELAIQNLFELAFLSMILCIYLLFVSLDKQVESFLKEAVTFWKSVTVPEQKELLIKMSKSHSVIIPFIKVAVLGSFLLFWLLPAIIPPILNIILPGEHNFTAKLCTTGELTLLDPEKYFFFWFGYTFIILTQAALFALSLCISQIFFISLNLARFRLLSFFANVSSIGRKVLIILHAYILIGLIFCGSMILFAKKVNNLFLLLEMIVSFAFIAFYAFLISYFGQILTDVSLEIRYESYSCGWYNFPLKTRPCILLIMLRAEYPCELTSGPTKALKLNYESYSALMNTAVSYMTIMASLI